MPLTRVLVFVAMVATAACGGSSTGNPPPPPPPPPGPPPPPASSTTITISNNSFSPSDNTISVGTITFHWASGSTQHNVTWLTGPSSPPGSGNRAQGGGDYTATLVAGDYTYRCTLHAGMNGAIHVTP